MEPIKVSVDVTVNLSESAKTFLSTLFSNSVPTPCTTAVAKEPTPAVAKEPTSTVTKSVGIEDVRKVLSEKVNDFRMEIKEKLNELGAPSVTKLDQSKYQEMYDFLKSLSNGN